MADKKIILETERLTLREFTKGDAEFIYKLLNSEGWLKYIGTRNINTTADAEKYITEKLMPGYEKNGFGFYMTELKDNAGLKDNTPIGMCGLVKREALEDIDIGFALLPENEGKGYAYEAASATMDYAKNVLGLKKIAGITVAYNKPSIRLLEKIGLTFDKMINMPDDKEELMYFTKTF